MAKKRRATRPTKGDGRPRVYGHRTDFRVLLAPELKVALTREARRQGVSRNALVCRLLEEGLEEIGDG